MKKAIYLVLTLCLGLGLAFVALEIALRIHDPFGFRVQGDKINLPRWRQYTIQNTQFPQLDPVIIHHKNSLGFRGPEPPADFTNYLTVVAVGGSTTEDFYLSDGQDWPNVLRRRLEPFFNRFWMNNAGFNGHSTFGHIVLLEDYLGKLKPRVAIFLVGANDCGRVDMKWQDDFFLKNKAGISSVKDVAKWLSAYSKVVDLIINLNRHYAAIKLGVIERKKIDLPALVMTKPTPPEMRDEILEQDRRDSLPGYQQRIRRILELCREKGIEPVLITQPMLYGPAKDDVTGVDLGLCRVTEYDGNTAWLRMEQFNDVVRRIAAEQNVPLIDLAREMPKSSKYYYDWGHYTKVGAEIVADLVCSHLKSYLEQKYPEYKIAESGDGSPEKVQPLIDANKP